MGEEQQLRVRRTAVMLMLMLLADSTPSALSLAEGLTITALFKEIPSLASSSLHRDGTQHRLKVKTAGSDEASRGSQAYLPSSPYPTADSRAGKSSSTWASASVQSSERTNHSSSFEEKLNKHTAAASSSRSVLRCIPYLPRYRETIL